MAATRITTQLLKDAAITTVKVAANAITLGKLGALSTKGSLITHDGSAHKAFAAGTNEYLLASDSNETDGLKWVDPTTVGSGVGIADFVFGEEPTGTIDGTNDAFTLANTPHSGTVRVYLNGVRMNEGAGNDYTISTDTITFESNQIPQTDDILLVDYIQDQS